MSEPDLSNRLWPRSLKCFDLTLDTEATNLALDEALLSVVEADSSLASLRFWKPHNYFVVLGRSNRAESEVNIPFCDQQKIPILRRSSGGGTVVVGPGCLCYSLVLPLSDAHRQLGISQITTQLMSRSAAGLRLIGADVDVTGTSDLAQQGWKVSGNAQRWLKNAFIHHGTLLFDFDLSLLSRCLAHPSREPDYRKSRPHAEFVKNLKIQPEELQRGMSSIWNANPEGCPVAILTAADRIATERYSSPEWRIR